MRQLTMQGFLSNYIKELSYSNTRSLYKLLKEATTTNFLLKEPLILYALYSNKSVLIERYLRDSSLQNEFEHVKQAVINNDVYNLPIEYKKVLN